MKRASSRTEARSYERALVVRVIDGLRAPQAEKIRRQLGHEGMRVGRDRVARLMRSLGVRWVVRGEPRRTTTPAEVAYRPADLVQRDFTAPAPCQACSQAPTSQIPGNAGNGACANRSRPATDR